MYYLFCYHSDEPQYTKPPPLPVGSLDSATKPLGSGGSGSDDSLVCYEDGDMGKFNEDGSFIGQYGGETKAEENHVANTTSPNALSTFV